MIRIHPDTFNFLNELQANNNRPWFEANKSRYTEARNQFVRFIGELSERVSKIEKIPIQNPAKNVFRIYRDVRFSKNKDPYKLNFGGWIDRGTKPSAATFYIQLQPGVSFIGGGIYMPTPAELKAIRREIHFQGDKLQKIIDSKAFMLEFGGLYEEGKLKKSPKGFEPDHPYIELLKFRHYVISKNITDDVILSEQFIDVCVNSYNNCLSFFHFLDNAILNSESN